MVSRTASPFLNPGANGHGTVRPKSPLVGSESESSQGAPMASRTISSPAVRKTTAAGAPRKVNVLGAKKTQKLGAKRVVGPDAIDFEAAEKKAKEEAERIEKLGYDPDAEQVTVASNAKAAGMAEKNKLAAPAPLDPGKAEHVSAKGHRERSEFEVERLGMGVGRLGFGQVGGGKSFDTPKKMGFVSVGSTRTAEEGLR